MEDPRIISALFIFLKMAYYNVLINNKTFFHFNLHSAALQLAAQIVMTVLSIPTSTL